jgi:osmotically-inducible protein OsmY
MRQVFCSEEVMEFTHTDVVTDPVGHISISGIHTREEIDARVASAGWEEEDRTAFGRVVAGALIGAAVMYLLDPDRGARRRSLVRDKFVRAGNATADRAGKLGRDVRNRAAGAVAETRARFRRERVDDAVLVERVRSEIGHRITHSGAIVVTATDGEVTLSGPVLAAEAGELRAAAESVRGVRCVNDRLEVHESAGNVPALQNDTT